MPTTRVFQQYNFRQSTLDVFAHARSIIASTFTPHGFTPTLRQLYYQFVKANLIDNLLKNYKSFGALMVKARLAGALPIDAFEDRTRFMRGLNHEIDIESALHDLAKDYLLDKWELSKQKHHVEVWCEKEALIQIVQRACEPLDVWYFACKGNPSLTSLWQASKRLRWWHDKGCQCSIIYVGDHDANGLDIPRSIHETLATLTGATWTPSHTHDAENISLDRIALTKAQIKKYSLPPQPAKLTGSRAGGYAALHGRESWELDALEPMDLVEIIQSAIKGKMDSSAWHKIYDRQELERETVQAVADNYEDVEEWMIDTGLVDDPDNETEE